MEDTPNTSPLPTDLITSPAAADMLHVSNKTLASWRSSGSGPDYIQYNRIVYYSRAAVEAFARASMVCHAKKKGDRPCVAS